MTKSHKKASVFRSLYRAAMESREREASRHVNHALRRFDDEELASRGIELSAFSGGQSVRALI
jgi:ABC-type Mn2+/Zn2+ transport system ATPase subunit